MATVKPLVMNFQNVEDLRRMEEEYKFIGRETDVDVQHLKLTVLTVAKKNKKARRQETRQHRHRDEN